MSTDYNLLPARKDNGKNELYILEHSNVFDITLSDNEFDQYSICDLTLEELKAIRDKLSDVISYFE